MKRKKRAINYRRSRKGKRASSLAPRTAADFYSRPKEFQEIWNRALHVVSRMRADGLSLAQASREYILKPRIVLNLVDKALRKASNGRYVARSRDRLLRILLIPTTNGLQEVALRDSRQATELAEYWDAVQRYLQKGDDSALRQFRGVRIKAADGQSVPLLTENEELDRLGNAGVLSFESLYARSA